MLYVIDTSAAIDALRGTARLPPRATEFFAPELIDLEVASVLRKFVLRHKLSEEIARAQIDGWARNIVVRRSHAALLPRVWELRHEITSHDAAFVALAEHLQIPLLTSDARLARTASRYCEVTTLNS